MAPIEILGSLYIKHCMKTGGYVTEKSHMALWSNLFKSLHV